MTPELTLAIRYGLKKYGYSGLMVFMYAHLAALLVEMESWENFDKLEQAITDEALNQLNHPPTVN
jgi:hypothetical protein